ncbi:Outer membrane protein assembly factor BamB [Planctomycetales bacterium 10988]|nr:Outer membrane protein assembly factor BamB [Planctomycetales bacterium 10988]
MASQPSLPLKWSAEENLAWKAELIGYGQSSPVVWEEMVYLTSVEGDDKENLWVFAFRCKDGTEAWKKVLPASALQKNDDYHSRGAPTPVVDAAGVYVFFESGDLFCFTHAGEVQWSKNLTELYGPIDGNHGLGTSPILVGNRVILQIDHGGQSYLLAVHKKTGETLWKTDRTTGASWSSPVAIKLNGKQYILTSSSGEVAAYDLENGKELWKLDGFEGNTVPSPTVNGEVMIIASGDPGNNSALPLKNITMQPELLWTARKATVSFSSPLVYRDRIYMVNRSGVATCLQLEDGEEVWNQRLPDSCWASPIASGDRIYFFTKEGTTVVMKAGDESEILAENPLEVEDRIYGVAAIPGAFLVRTGSLLYCFGKPSE